MTPNRLRAYYFYSGIALAYAKEGEKHFLPLEWIPEDSEIVSMEIVGQDLKMIITSSEFDEIAEGANIPEIRPVIRNIARESPSAMSVESRRAMFGGVQ